MRTFASILALTATLGLAMPASAHEAGDWLVRVGGSMVNPKSGNGSLDASALKLGEQRIDVDDAWSLTFNITYMYTANIGIELLAAWPFEHDIDVEDLGTVGSVKHLPPTLSVQYHFNPTGAFQPYAGIGLNYTAFFSESESGVLKDLDGTLDVDSSSWGLAAQLGFDYMINDQWFVNVDVRWIGIDTRADVTVPGVGTIRTSAIEIDPMVYGLHIGYRF
jgi:outer membrane protein